jgi:hypothetical protein
MTIEITHGDWVTITPIHWLSGRLYGHGFWTGFLTTNPTFPRNPPQPAVRAYRVTHSLYKRNANASRIGTAA